MLFRSEAAQKKVEERNFEVRKNLLEYDEVMDEQRRRVYGFRQRILDGHPCRDLIMEMVDRQIDENIGAFLDKDYGPQTYATWASGHLSCEVDGKDFRGMSPEEAERLAADEAIRQSETQIFDAVEENLPEGEEESEWNWSALATFANARWKLSVNDRDLKRAGRGGVAEFLQDRAREAIQRMDLHEGRRFLAPDFGIASARGWTEWRFGLPLEEPTSGAATDGHDPEAVKDAVRRTARDAYARREDHYGEAMPRMERAVVLQILDNAWKDHLLAMDHLRASVGLRGYAQVDPKVEYKREGMRTFDLMWKGIDERVIDIVYRIEQVEDNAVRSAFKETAAIHEEAPVASLPEPGQAADQPPADGPVEPIRNFGQRVGRNDPCPCGSGKKFKNCCGKSSSVATGS